MLDNETKKKIDDARDILVGKVPVPSAQVEQITVALIYKFMYDMDNESVELGGNPQYFTGEYTQYAWNKLFDTRISGEGRVLLYQEALTRIPTNADIPTLFRDIFKNAFLPYRDPVTLRLFLATINEFTYDHSEKLGDAFEYLLAILGSQGDAGQFRTPRHIIDFIVALIDPQKEDSILDPACGTAGFLISAYKHILKHNSENYDTQKDPLSFELSGKDLSELVINGKNYRGEKLNPNQREYLHQNIVGYDIAFEMVRLSLVNMYLHGFSTPKIYEYDTLTSEERWNDHFNVILANPPFMTPKGGIRPHSRFSIKSNRSEVLFVDYILEHLTANGKAGVIVPEGIIFQNTKAHTRLRQLLVDENYLVGVISLPSGVFNPYSAVKTSILWIDKSLARKTDKIIFLKVDNDGYNLGAQRKAIAGNDLPDIFAYTEAYKKAVQRNVEYVCEDERVSLVGKSRLAEGGEYNLSGGRYVNLLINSIPAYNTVSLGDVCDLYQPKTITSNDMVIDGKYSVFGANGIIGRYDNYNHKDGEVAITCRGASCGTVNMTLPESWITGNAMVAHPKTDELLKKFLYYILKHSDLSSTISGSAQPQITRTSLSPFQIPLPPLPIQEEIVAELDSYQKIIDGARMVIENWKPRIDVDPKWEVVRINDVADINPKPQAIASSSIDATISFLPMREVAINNVYIRPIETRMITDMASRGYTQFNDNDVLIAKITPCFENGKIGISKELLNDLGYGSTEFHVIRCNDRVLPEIIYLYLSSSEFHKHAIPLMTGSAGQKRVPTGVIRDYHIYLPPLCEQHTIVDKLKDEMNWIKGIRDMEESYGQKIIKAINKLWS